MAVVRASEYEYVGGVMVNRTSLDYSTVTTFTVERAKRVVSHSTERRLRIRRHSAVVIAHLRVVSAPSIRPHSRAWNRTNPGLPLAPQTHGANRRASQMPMALRTNGTKHRGGSQQAQRGGRTSAARNL